MKGEDILTSNDRSRCEQLNVQFIAHNRIEKNNPFKVIEMVITIGVSKLLTSRSCLQF